MKKIKAIFSALLLFVTCAVLCVGCGSNKGNPDNSNTTKISLAEAEATIVKALAINNRSGLTTMAEDETNVNRDLMEKFGNFTASMVQVDVDVDNQKIMAEIEESGVITYHNHNFVSYVTNSVEVSSYHKANDRVESASYFADNRLYRWCIDESSSDGRTWEVKTDNIQYASNYENLKGVFGKEAFEGVYGDEVVKTINANGYSLTLQGDFKGYMYYFFIFTGGLESSTTFEEMWESYEAKMKTRYSQAVLDSCYMKVIINFDNHDEITDAVVELVGLTPHGDEGVEGNYYNIQNTVTYTIAKTDADVKQPQWLTDYLASQN